ncbi:hypothetical protein C0J52_04466, partial [Blattella germanica]
HKFLTVVVKETYLCYNGLLNPSNLTVSDFFSLWMHKRQNIHTTLFSNIGCAQEMHYTLINYDYQGYTMHIWDKLQYRLDVCHVTKGSHIEHL